MESWETRRRNMLGELREGIQTLAETLNHRRGILDRLKGTRYSTRISPVGIPTTELFYLEKFYKSKNHNLLWLGEPRIDGVVSVFYYPESLKVTEIIKDFLRKFSRKYQLQPTINYVVEDPKTNYAYINRHEEIVV